MNIEQLNSCFDAISPTKEQKEKIFAGIMSAKQQPVKVIKFHRYATAAAAVIVIGAFAAVYSNIGTNDITNLGNKTTVAIENSKDSVENTPVNKEVVETDENIPETNNVKAEQKNLTAVMSEEYPEIMEEVTEDVKVAVENDATFNMNKVADTDNVVPEMAMDTSGDEAVAPAASGGGGGGSASSSTTVYRAAGYEYITLEQIMSDNVYADLFPTAFVDGFELVSATKSDYNMRAVFEDNEGRYMSVWIINGGTFDFREDVIKPEDVINLKPEYGFFNFALDCDGCYVIYNVESDDALQVYEMVKSSAYFKN